MATKVYVGANNIARIVRKMYIGVNGVARKIRKGYIGAGGIARLFFLFSGKVTYKEAKSLSDSRSELGAITIGGYAIFGPGVTTGSNALIDTYNTLNSSLTASTITGTSRSDYGVAKVGNKALFAGGYDGTTAIKGITSIDESLTMTSSAANLGSAKFGFGSASTETRAIFGGGSYWRSGLSDNSYYDSVDSFDSSLTRTALTDFSTDRAYLPGATARSLAVFAGGYDGSSYLSSYNYYDLSATMHSGGSIGFSVAYHAAASLGKYAIFAGGENSNSLISNTVAINGSGTCVSAASLSKARRNLTATVLGDYAVFAGGSAGYHGSVYSNVDIYDTSLTRQTGTALSEARTELAATAIGDYALFGWGTTTTTTPGSPTNTVDIYELTY